MHTIDTTKVFPVYSFELYHNSLLSLYALQGLNNFLQLAPKLFFKLLKISKLLCRRQHVSSWIQCCVIIKKLSAEHQLSTNPFNNMKRNILAEHLCHSSQKTKWQQLLADIYRVDGRKSIPLNVHRNG